MIALELTLIFKVYKVLQFRKIKTQASKIKPNNNYHLSYNKLRLNNKCSKNKRTLSRRNKINRRNRKKRRNKKRRRNRKSYNKILISHNRIKILFKCKNNKIVKINS